MEVGDIVEYIDRQKIVCAVVLEVKQQRLRLLTEANREVNLSAKRLLHRAKSRIALSGGRDRIVDTLKGVVKKREALLDQVDVQDLWEVLNSEQEWIDLSTMTEFCFPNEASADHESAVIRAFFDDHLYFKFNPDRFFPHSAEQVQRLIHQREEQIHKHQMIEDGARWIKSSLFTNMTPDQEKIPAKRLSKLIAILKDAYLHGRDSRDYSLVKAMLDKAGIQNPDRIFQVLVNAGIFDEDANVDLLRYEIATDFPAEVLAYAADRVASFKFDASDAQRRDLTDLRAVTIDGQGTLDFDDALSIEEKDRHLRLGVHIADVGRFVARGDRVDKEAMERGSSIYMPDQKISMLPPSLAEGLCSLKAGEKRPAISTLIDIAPTGDIVDYEIVPSFIKVQQQLTYFDVNQLTDQNKELDALHDIAVKFRQQRLDAGALQITLPEISIWINAERQLVVNKIDRESPSRLLVAEIMIMANWLMAKFLDRHKVPAIFRSQPEPRERLYLKEEGTLFQNWMQRKFINRFVLNHQPEWHSGLGLEAYVTATSPIRKFFDLVTQRQIRSVFGLEEPYTASEIDAIVHSLELTLSRVARVQYQRHRYWLLKHLEKCVGQKEEAVVLYKKRNSYQILLTKYMLECDMPVSAGINIQPEDLVQVTIQQVSARRDSLVVFIG